MGAATITRHLFLAVPVLLLAGCEADDQGHRAMGELASDRIEISAEFAEPITRIAVVEGTAVKAGEVLLELDASRATARLAEAEAALGQARARQDELLRGPRAEQIAAARANVEGASRELAFRQADLRRVKDIHERELASAEQLDQATVAADTARASLQIARAQLQERLAGTTAEELAQAEQAVKQAMARRDAARVDLDRHSLRAPLDAIADSRLFELGERPAPGQPVMVLLGGAQPHARVYVPEAWRARVRIGTAARVRVDGIEQVLQGRVRWVASEAAFTPYHALTERDRGRLSFVAKVDIETDLARLPDGVPVEVEFLLDPAR